MSAFRFIVAVVVFVTLLLLALSNTGPVTLRVFDFAELDSPLAFVVFVAFAAGVAAGLGAGAARSARLKRQVKALRHELRATPRPPAPHGAVPGAYPTPARPPQDAL